MNRLQISLTQTQYEFLKSESFAMDKSMASIVRELLDSIIGNRQRKALETDPIWQVIGIGETLNGPTDTSNRVDHYLCGSPLPATENHSQSPLFETIETIETNVTNVTNGTNPSFPPTSFENFEKPTPSKNPTSLKNPITPKKTPIPKPIFDPPAFLNTKTALEPAR